MTGEPPEIPREVSARVSLLLRRGALLFGAAVAALALGTSLPFWDVLGIPFFYLLLPAVAVAQVPLLATERLDRLQVYVGSAAAILVIGWLAAVLGLRLDGGARALGLVLVPAAELAAWALGAAAAGVLLVVLFHPIDRRVAGPHHRFLADLMPRNGTEKLAFLGVSGAAGIGEELAYRGYALVALQLLGVAPVLAVLASSASFGFLHAYQGPVGIVRTGLMGVVLAVPLLYTGSLVPSMIGHALIDVVLGIALGRRLLAGGADDRGTAGSGPDRST